MPFVDTQRYEMFDYMANDDDINRQEHDDGNKNDDIEGEEYADVVRIGKLFRLIEVVITFIICHENEMQKYFGVGCLFFSTSIFFLSKCSTISVRSYQAYNTHTQNSCV